MLINTSMHKLKQLTILDGKCIYMHKSLLKNRGVCNLFTLILLIMFRNQIYTAVNYDKDTIN